MVEQPYTPPAAPAPQPAPATPPRGGAPQAPPGYAQPAYPPPAYTPGYPPPPTYPYPPAPYGPPPGYHYPPRGYVYEPPPPPPVQHRAPASSFWLGARAGFIAPYGRVGYYDYPYAGPSWSDFAGPGASFEADVGGRIARRWVVYGLWEYARFGTTTSGYRYDSYLPTTAALSSSSSSLVGVGVRWTSHPDDVGFLVDFALGYRWADASWDDGTQLHLSSPLEGRIGFGADIRLSRSFSLSPMLVFSSGTFTDATITRPGAAGVALPYGASADHGTVGIQLGAHFDVAPSR